MFTPCNIVRQVLDIAGYTHALYGKRILENSCGDGQFLTEIVRRYIEDCRNYGYNDDSIKTGLERDVWGAEIDPLHVDNCIRNLNQILLDYKMPTVNWNILVGDVLKHQFDVQFHYVVGNPPYITYSALKEVERKFIRSTFEVCAEGKPDYYYAFIESAIKQLRGDGKLVYLVPSNFLKTRFGAKLRNYLLPSITEIYDYSTKKLFAATLTASAVIVYENGSDAESVKYHDIAQEAERRLPKSSLARQWVFGEINQAPQTHSGKKLRFGDLFSASSSIATLYNEAYIVKRDASSHGILDVAQQYNLEPAILRPTASPKSLQLKRQEYIIFPYQYVENQLQKYKVNDFESQFPLTVAHLRRFSTELSERDCDKNAQWFEYGRSQALAHLNQEKLLISTLITGRVRVYELDKETIPYSGIYITQVGEKPLSEARRILTSQQFFEYIRSVGIQANGTSIRISISDINNYTYCETQA